MMTIFFNFFFSSSFKWNLTFENEKSNLVLLVLLKHCFFFMMLIKSNIVLIKTFKIRAFTIIAKIERLAESKLGYSDSTEQF